MIVHYWSSQTTAQGSNVPTHLDIYRSLYNPELKGIPLAKMKGYLGDLGYRAFTMRGEWKDLTQHLSKGRPIIVAQKKDRTESFHFAVLTGDDGSHVWLNDPGHKRPERISRTEFNKRWAAAERWMLIATPQKP
jgi:ABC-type bacteriocin/lantibiotic exporter with double-glycine peptidase domain